MAKAIPYLLTDSDSRRLEEQIRLGTEVVLAVNDNFCLLKKKNRD